MEKCIRETNTFKTHIFRLNCFGIHFSLKDTQLDSTITIAKQHNGQYTFLVSKMTLVLIPHWPLTNNHMNITRGL